MILRPLAGLLGVAIVTVGSPSFAGVCDKFPDYCRAAKILNGQPNIDIELGLRTQAQLRAIESSISAENLSLFLETISKNSAQIEAKIDASRIHVNAVLAKANSGGKLKSVIGFLRTVATLAKIAHEIQEFASENSKKMVKPKDNGAATPKATPGIQTLFGKMNEGKRLSDQAAARVETLLAANAGGRYFAVKAIIGRLNELGRPTQNADFSSATEQEILLSKAYSIISGWELTDADSEFENFEFRSSSLDDFVKNPQKANPFSLFADIIFTARPVGDGTVFSKNTIPSLLSELEPHATDIMKWRAPDYFGADNVVVPWRQNDQN